MTAQGDARDSVKTKRQTKRIYYKRIYVHVDTENLSIKLAEQLPEFLVHCSVVK